MTRAFDARTSQSWWLADACVDDVQAIVGTGFGGLPHGVAMLLSIPPAGGAWLGALDVTTAAAPRAGQTHAITLALTHEGLRRSGLPRGALDRFAAPFREGMTQADRARRLGDLPDADDAPGTLAAEGLAWSGAAAGDGPGPAAPPRGSAYAQAHALVLLYAASAAALETERARRGAALAAAGADIVREIALTPGVVAEGEAPREHFGFVDGLSQPFPEDAPDASEAERAIRVTRPGPAVEAALAQHRVRTGDLLFGRPDAYGERPGGIFLDAAEAGDLPQGAAAPGQRDFGWNGGFLVARELTQDVAAFWRAVGTAAEDLPAAAVAAKMVGRSIDGDLLTPEGPGVNNDVGFAARDRHGFGCPLGSHVRRSNPRDSGARDADEAATRLGSTNNHRILRRGRNFGPPAFPGRDGAAGRPPETSPEAGVVEPDARRGLLFMCLVTDIARQFEFVQQTWLNGRHFGGLGQTDPIMGPAGHFSFPAAPVRRRVPAATFVRLAGGEYFFLPGRGALDWLSRRSKAQVAPEAART